MKTATIGKIALTLALGVLIGGMSALPARAGDDRGHQEARDRGHDERGRGHEREHHEFYRYNEGPRYVVPPPPVYYAPPPRQPVIDLFPIIIR